MKQLNYTINDYTDILVRSPIGLMLKEHHAKAEALRVGFGTSLYPIGKLITQRRSEEIAEFDGTNGARSWISIGNEVYDITSKIPM